MIGGNDTGWCRTVQLHVSCSVRLDRCLIRVGAALAECIIKDDKFCNAISGVLLVEASVGRSSL